MKQPLVVQRSLLPFVGVSLECLDENKKPVGFVGSGFIRRENNRLFLYTCWHLVSGFDLNDIKIGRTRPNRRHVRVDFKGAAQRAPGVEVIGGLQTVILPLYDTSTELPRPCWLQDDRHIPHPDLNAIGIFVPFWHDLVKLELPADVRVSDLQVIDETRVFYKSASLVTPGDKCLVVGFPYGFSSVGSAQPTPVVLTRFVASDRVVNRRRELLLESIGAPGMSGGPVFIERGEDLLLFGLYTGLIYPDFAVETNDKSTALGTVADLSLILGGHLPLVSIPSETEDPRAC